MSHTFRYNPDTQQKEVERRHLKRKVKKEPLDAMKHQVLLGYDHLGDAVFGTDPKVFKEENDDSN